MANTKCLNRASDTLGDNGCVGGPTVVEHNSKFLSRGVKSLPQAANQHLRFDEGCAIEKDVLLFLQVDAALGCLEGLLVVKSMSEDEVRLA